MFQTLPNETFIRILKNLNHSELLKVSEVSKRFYAAATDTSLWKDFDISHRSLDNKIKVLQLPRCKKLKTLKLTDSDGGVNDEILQILMKIDLEILELIRVNFESIDKVLLLNVFSKTKAVYLIKPVNLEQDQVNMITKRIPGSGLKELMLQEVKFSGVAARTVAEAINSLEIFKVAKNQFNDRQRLETIEVMSKKTNLQKMILCTGFLKNIPASILGKALNKITCLRLGSKTNSLPSEQIRAIFNEMSQQTNLQQLHLLFPDSSEGSIISFPADILTKAISKLEVFLAPQLKFSESQIKSVFQSIDLSKIRLLDLGSCNEPQFSLVNQKSLISVSHKIKADMSFKLLLLIKNLEINIKKLQKVQEENDKMKEVEEKLSAEEMSKQWGHLAWEVYQLANKRVEKEEIYRHIHRMENVYSNIQHRMEEATRIIIQKI